MARHSGALPASALAAEAGVSASTVSRHLSRLLAAELLTVERVTAGLRDTLGVTPDWAA
ncbi:MAG TPA: helix-turn-helix domain-containing protein [Pseudonocardia sp.]|nr:helix-turn-helix domain-containing protein [Pseudonocardia sp.]